MVRPGCLQSLLIATVLGAAVIGFLYCAGPPLGLMLKALAGWGLLSLPIGLLVGHYCALGDEPTR
jgi:hypothetical protein